MIEILHKSIWIGQVGFLVSLFLEVGALISAVKIVTLLPNLNSFTDIATLSYIGLTCGVLGAAMAIMTLRTDSEEFPED